ncbi:MAG: portal protein [Thiomonas sp.]
MMHKELKWRTEAHDKLRNAVWQRFVWSRDAFASRRQAWARAEELFAAYTPLNEEEKSRQRAQREGESTFSQIVVPFSYATLLAAHSYWTSVFLGRDVVFQYTARHGEGHQKVQAVESVIDYQVHVGGCLAPLYLWLLDAGKYGIGILGNYWDEEYSSVSRYEMVPREIEGIELPGPGKKTLVRDVVRAYAGNRLFNVRPMDWFPDPRVSVLRFQEGEFCARYVATTWNALRKSPEGYFNLDVVRDRFPTFESVMHREAGRSTELPVSDGTRQWDIGRRQSVELIEMVWELIPSEWGLGDSDYPEKWVITLAGGEVIIGCRPQGLYHNKFPYFILAYDMDAHSLNLRGLMEVLEPLENTLSWLLNSHLFNVRRAINDQLVVDPSRVVMRDLLEGGPGRIIRLNPSAYGSDVRAAITQLPVVDITRQHLQSVQAVVDLIQRVSGVTDNIMGLVNTGGRKTATEVRTSTSFGVNRLKTFCEFNSALGFEPLSQALLQNTQQLMDEQITVRVAGDLLQGDPHFITVSPDDISGFYDFVPVDGTLPIDRFAQANLWKEILMGLAQMPQIASQYDIAGIFSWMAQLAGLKNITQFRVMSDQALAQQVAAGNMRQIGPMEALQNAARENIAGGSPAAQIGPKSALGL